MVTSIEGEYVFDHRNDISGWIIYALYAIYALCQKKCFRK